MNYAVVFPGQGTQSAGMLEWIDASEAARPVLDAMAHHIGRDWRARLHDVEWATSNAVAQVLIVGTSLAAWRHLAQHLAQPSIVAGYSVGELTALACAGVISDREAIELAHARAAAMDDAVRGQSTGLLAVNSGARLSIETLIASPDVELAIDIGPGRCVLGGSRAAIDAASVHLSAHGAKCTRLAVNVASHTSLMREARAPLLHAFDRVKLQPALMRVVANATGRESLDAAVLQAAFVDQLDSTVRWHDCMQTIAERAPACVLAVGPGRSLLGYWPVAERIPMRAVEDFSSPAAAMQWVAALTEQPLKR